MLIVASGGRERRHDYVQPAACSRRCSEELPGRSTPPGRIYSCEHNCVRPPASVGTLCRGDGDPVIRVGRTRHPSSGLPTGVQPRREPVQERAQCLGHFLSAGNPVPCLLASRSCLTRASSRGVGGSGLSSATIRVAASTKFLSVPGAAASPATPFQFRVKVQEWRQDAIEPATLVNGLNEVPGRCYQVQVPLPRELGNLRQLVLFE